MTPIELIRTRIRHHLGSAPIRHRVHAIARTATAAGWAALLTTSALLIPAAGSAGETAVTLPPLEVEARRDGYFETSAAGATKTDTPVLETPQSITVITREQLDDLNPQTVKDALNYSAGVLSAADTTSRYDSVFLRGFGGFGTSTRIVDFLDGLKLPRGQAFALPSVDPFLLDGIQVLKGPSAVLYGQTSPGGLINQVSRAPGAASLNEARVEAGTHGRLQAGITSRGTLDETGNWQYSISGIGRHSGTRYDGVDEERAALAPALTWAPDEDTRLTLQSFYQYDPEGGYFNSIYPKSRAPEAYQAALSPELNVGDPDYDSYEREQFALGYGLDHRISRVFSISSKARYFAMDLDFQSLQMAAPVTASGLLLRQAARSIEAVSGISADNHMQMDFTTGTVGHRVLAGVDLQHSISDWEYRFGMAPSLDVTHPQYGVSVGPLTPFINNEQTLQQTGIYAQDQLRFGRLHTLIGLRYDWTRQETENRLTRTNSSQSGNAPSYRAGLIYNFASGIAPYASYSTSFEPVIGVDAGGIPFEPSEAAQWELGLKYQPGFMKALFTVSVFDIRQENVLTPGVTPGFNVQQGEVRSRGLEFEARGSLTPRLELIGALTLVDTEVTESTVSSTLGKRPQAVPRAYGSLWANYAFDFGRMDGLTLGGGIRYVGSSFADDANTIETDSSVLADAAVRYDLGSLTPSLAGTEATLNATNLFDKEYYASCSSDFYCQYGNGRQVVLGLRYRW